MSEQPTQLGENRDSFFSRVREALGGVTDEAPQPPELDESLVRLASANDDLLPMFTQRAEQVGMRVHQVTGETAPRKVVELLGGIEAQRVVLGAGGLGRDLELHGAIRGQGIELIDWRSHDTFEPQYEADAGITDVEAALAETGTLIIATDEGRSRGLSLVPPVHIALVRREQILPDMLDYWRRHDDRQPHDLPSSIVFITGPSKTADIEGQLVTGVHGPGQVHILLLEA